MTSSVTLLLLVLCSVGLAQCQLKLYDLRASKLPSDIFGTTDGYVKVFCGSASLGRTSVRKDTVNPWWDEEFTHFQAKEDDVLKLEVFDKDFLFDDLLGICQRSIKRGSHTHDCYLKKGGILHYNYTLD